MKTGEWASCKPRPKLFALWRANAWLRAWAPLAVVGLAIFMAANWTVAVPAAPMPPRAPDVKYSEQRVALYEAARVYGKFGCPDAKSGIDGFDLAEATARHAVRNGLPAGVVAAKVAIESSCNPLAISNMGAIGLTQVRVSAWKSEYDFSRVNLLNPEDSLRVGTEILGAMVKRHGLRKGLRCYNGARCEGEATAEYADRILKLAGVK